MFDTAICWFQIMDDLSRNESSVWMLAEKLVQPLLEITHTDRNLYCFFTLGHRQVTLLLRWITSEDRKSLC